MSNIDTKQLLSNSVSAVAIYWTKWVCREAAFSVHSVGDKKTYCLFDSDQKNKLNASMRIEHFAIVK